MHLQPPQSSGPQTHSQPKEEPAQARPACSTLPFGHHLDLSSVTAATYLTAQTLIQQNCYLLSDKIFTYSPETFDLDLSLKRWEGQEEKNAHGFVPGVQQMQTRNGAGTIALGYMFSPDFDLAKRHIPQTILASSGSLVQLRSSLDQLSLLYSVANPVALQIAAVDYTAKGSTGLVADYVATQTLADDLGFAMVASTSIYESQHMALLATLLSHETPAVHVYDGINVGRETTRVVDVLGKDGLHTAYKNVKADTFNEQTKRLDSTGKTLKLFGAFNDELGTDYKPFEYYGHPEAETVLVVFGSVEGALAAQMAHVCAQAGQKVGAINVRLYRPFIDDSFIESLPATVREIKILGQVRDEGDVGDDGVSSRLYSDALAAVAFTRKFATNAPAIVDLKYARSDVWNPAKMAKAMGSTREDDILGPSVKQYSFWDRDSSTSIDAATSVAELLSQNIPDNVAVCSSYNTLVRGGTFRADLRTSSRSIEAPYSVNAAKVTYIGHEDLFQDFNILRNVPDEGIVIARLPGSRSQDEEKFSKRLSEPVRKTLVIKNIRLFALDTDASTALSEDQTLENLLVQLAFLKFADPSSKVSYSKFEAHFSKESMSKVFADLEHALYQIEYPESWKSLEVHGPNHLPADTLIDSFVPYPEDEPEPTPHLNSTTSIAQSLAFREAFQTHTATRPDTGTQAFTVHVREHRRLTPLTYDRNIFHIEFDLGTSGLKYNLGEALGIHAENNVNDVLQFIDWYHLNPDAVVAVPARADPEHATENRTIYQSLMQNIDIFGRPPKRFYADLAEFASNPDEEKELKALGGPEGAVEFKRRGEVDTVTYADILLEFPSAHPNFADITRLVAPLKRREYSIASSQHVQPNSVSLLIVTVGWVDPQGRDRFGQATRYLDGLKVGDPVTVSVKPSVMKLPPSTTAPIIMAGLGTGLAPFRAFVQERAYQRDTLQLPVGPVLLFLGSRHQKQEYLYGEEWEAYQDAGIITHMGCAFSRDQAEKIYIQGRMREAMEKIREAMWRGDGAFYLCGPTWPVPDVTGVLEESVEVEKSLKRGRGKREVEALKEEGRYVLEVY
ncbi:MAG: hypothetical protein Q9162_002201 [Coniocarpon cinnabarinum]